MGARHFLAAAGDEAGVEDCVAHRCDEHEQYPPVNSDGPNLSECAICVGEAFVRAFEQKIWNEIFWPAIDSAAARLEFFSPGSGDSFVKETRARIQAAQMDPDAVKH